MGYLTSVVIKDNVCLQELNTTNTRKKIFVIYQTYYEWYPCVKGYLEYIRCIQIKLLFDHNQLNNSTQMRGLPNQKQSRLQLCFCYQLKPHSCEYAEHCTG